MNHILFRLAEFLSTPPGFYVMLVLMAICTLAIPLGIDENVITFGLSVLAIVITGVVLIQGYRDTAAIHAKLDELIIALEETRNDVVGLEKEEPKKIAAELERLEEEADHGRGKGRRTDLHGSQGPAEQRRASTQLARQRVKVG